MYTKVKNVVIPSLEVEDADEAWLANYNCSECLKNESYQVKKVGCRSEEISDIVLEAVNIYSQNNGAFRNSEKALQLQMEWRLQES